MSVCILIGLSGSYLVIYENLKIHIFENFDNASHEQRLARHEMNHITRKPVFGVFNDTNRAVYTPTEDG